MPGKSRGKSKGYYHEEGDNDTGDDCDTPRHWADVDTRFPSSSAMFYQSDAQRSDTATVCSGSVLEDIELESVLSQEDLVHQGKPAAVGSGRRGSSDGNRLVEFADSSAVIVDSTMGPPLKRTLLLQQEYATLSASHPTESLKSYGSGSDGGGAHSALYSDDCESTNSREGISAPLFANDDKCPGSGRVPRADSVKSYGSNSASVADTDDCGGSLDVETHSVGARSIHSQDDAPTSAGLPEQDSETALSQLSSASIENGRRSPGGTIYKGRGIRRYQGRYMHLPLKRFHQNGVHLDDDDHDYEHQVSVTNSEAHRRIAEKVLQGLAGNDSNGGIHPDWNDPRAQLDRPDLSLRQQASRGRSRSRSRSPSPNRSDDDHDGSNDRKPRARR